MNHSSDPLQDFTIRLSVNGQALGSGFLVSPKSDPQFVYLITALHCLEGLEIGASLSIDRFNYKTGILDSVGIAPDEFRIIAFQRDISELCLVRFLKNKLSYDIPEILIRRAPTAGINYSFRGFPKAYGNNEPLEIEINKISNLGKTFIGKTDETLEDNLTTAPSNVKGFSGSGVFRLVNGQVELSGMITHYKAFNRFAICPFVLLDDLLEREGLPRWLLLPPLETVDQLAQKTTPASYYELSSRFFASAELLIEELKPSQANNILDTALPQIKKDPIDEHDRKSLLAQLHFLKGLAMNDLGSGEDSYDSLIVAYRLLPSNLDYQERAAIALLKTGQKEEALELAEQILNIHRANPRAWVVLSQIFPDTDVPSEVSHLTIFKTLSISFWKSNQSQVPISDFAIYFKEEASQRIQPPHKIPRSDLYYWFYLAQFVFFDFLTSNLKIHSIKKNDQLANAEPLLYVAKLYESILKRVDQTELKEHKTFLLCQFDFLICKYFLTGDKTFVTRAYRIFTSDEADPLAFNPIAPLRDRVPARAFDMLICLLQVGETGKAMKIFENYPEPFDPHLYLLKAYATEKEGNKSESMELYKQYLSHCKLIGQLELGNFCDVITILKGFKVPDESLLQLSLANKSFDEPHYELLLRAFIKLDSTEDLDEVSDLCQRVYTEDRNKLDLPLSGLLGFMFFKLGSAEKTVDLLSGQIDIQVSSEEHRLYIIALRQSGKDFRKLFELLENWRKSLPADDELTEIEVNLSNELRNHQLTEQAARHGIKHFPTNPLYIVRLIDALNWQEKRDELIPLLDKSKLTGLELHWRTFFQLGNVCFVNEDYETGLDLYYHGLKKYPNDPQVFESYFMNMASYPEVNKMPYPEVAVEGNVVQLAFEGKDIIIELTPSEIAYKPLAKNLLGCRVGQQVIVADHMTRRNKSYTIVKIVDKYRGQLVLFSDRINKNPDAAENVRVIVFDENDPESFFAQMQQQFGQQGTEIKALREEYLDKFHNREICFTQLYRWVFGDKPLSAWRHITSRYSRGFPVVPLIKQKDWNTESSTEFVLDFSTIFTLFHVCVDNDLRVEGKPFIISQLLKDYILSEAVECRIRQREHIGVEITEESVESDLLSQQQIDQQSQYYRDLLAWINKYCRTDFDPRILNIKFKKNSSEEIDLHQRCLVDTIQLANNPSRLLLSDDSLHYADGSAIKAITVEHFLAKYHHSNYLEKFSFNLIRLNYRGLTLQSAHLFQCFRQDQPFDDAQSDFQLVLNSFLPVNNPSGLNLFHILMFIRDLYAAKTKLKTKREVSSMVVRQFLSNLEISWALLESMELTINELFASQRKNMLRLKADILTILNELRDGEAHDCE